MQVSSFPIDDKIHEDIWKDTQETERWIKQGFNGAGPYFVPKVLVGARNECAQSSYLPLHGHNEQAYIMPYTFAAIRHSYRPDQILKVFSLLNYKKHHVACRNGMNSDLQFHKDNGQHYVGDKRDTRGLRDLTHAGQVKSNFIYDQYSQFIVRWKLSVN